jgi:hypothetical protein
MRSFVRSLLTLLLLVALPLQGFAVSAMTHCQPSQHASHDGHGMHAMHDDADTALDHDMSGHGKHRCSACASCCVGGALMPRTLVLPPCSLLHEHPLMARARPPAFLTDGTERPPRSTFA